MALAVDELTQDSGRTIRVAAREREELEEGLRAMAGGASYMTVVVKERARALLDALRAVDEQVGDLMASHERLQERAVALGRDVEQLEADLSDAQDRACVLLEVAGALHGEYDPDAVIHHGAPDGD